MAGEDGFLSRWSKRKRGDLAEPEAVARMPAPVSPVSASDDPSIQLNLPEVPEVGEPEFDLASLPSLDELTGTSDISAFLQKGVPEALQNAALRKAWVLDPLIRDHIEPIECGWDFNDPTSMTGFGPLDANVDPAAMLKQIMGQPEPVEAVSGELVANEMPPEEPLADGSAASEASAEASADDGRVADADSAGPEGGSLLVAQDEQEAGVFLVQNYAAAQHDGLDKIEEFPVLAGKRRHGGAVPG